MVQRFQTAPRKSAALILVLLAAAFCPACLERQVIQPAPRTITLDMQKPLPYQAALYFSGKSKNLSYQSPEFIPWMVRPNMERIRPFEVPVGPLFAKTALQAFSQVFQTVTIVDSPPALGEYFLLIEPSLEIPTLDLVYFSTDSKPPNNQFLNISGSVEGTLRLTREGKPDWQKTYRVPIQDRLLVNPWTGQVIAEMIAEALAALAGKMAQEMAGNPDQPAVPLDQWLKPLPGK